MKRFCSSRPASCPVQRGCCQCLASGRDSRIAEMGSSGTAIEVPAPIASRDVITAH